MNLADIDLNLLHAFAALHDTRSVTGAARRLGLGQPAMSAALARLRALLQDEVFVRSGGEMRPTERAQALAPDLLAALAQVRRALESGIRFDPATATRCFRLAATDYAALVLLPPLMAELERAAPSVDLRVVGYDKDAVADMLARSEIDLALGVFPDPPRDSVVTRLFEDRFVGIARAGHPAIRAGRIALADYAALPHALITTRRDAAGAVDAALARHGLRRRVALTLPYMMALPEALRGADLLAALPARLATRLEGAGLQCFDLPVETPPWTVAMLWPSLARGDAGLAWLRRVLPGCVKP